MKPITNLSILLLAALMSIGCSEDKNLKSVVKRPQFYEQRGQSDSELSKSDLERCYNQVYDREARAFSDNVYDFLTGFLGEDFNDVDVDTINHDCDHSAVIEMALSKNGGDKGYLKLTLRDDRQGYVKLSTNIIKDYYWDGENNLLEVKFSFEDDDGYEISKVTLIGEVYFIEGEEDGNTYEYEIFEGTISFDNIHNFIPSHEPAYDLGEFTASISKEQI